MILLDGLDVPNPAQLVRDCQAAGAAGCWVYVLRRAADGSDLGIGTWTAAHVAALRQAGLLAPAITVPGSTPPSPGVGALRAQSMGCSPILAIDLEQFSTPPAEWVGREIAATRGYGGRVVRYGGAGTLAGYPSADGDWLARWLRTGSLGPVPTSLPAGYVAWQYVDGVGINGSSYDVSTADVAFFGGGPMQLDPADPIVQQIVASLSRVEADLLGNLLPPGGDPAGGHLNQRLLFERAQLGIALDAARDAITVAIAQAPAGSTPDQLAHAVLVALRGALPSS